MTLSEFLKLQTGQRVRLLTYSGKHYTGTVYAELPSIRGRRLLRINWDTGGCNDYGGGRFPTSDTLNRLSVLEAN